MKRKMESAKKTARAISDSSSDRVSMSPAAGGIFIRLV